MLEKVAKIKRFEYLQLGCVLKKQSDIAKDQYKRLKGQKKMVLLIIKILDSNKLLTRLSIILTAKIKAGKNSNKLKNEIIQTVYLLYQQNK